MKTASRSIDVPLFQEKLRHDPFWMLVMCILVNKTSGRAAEPVLETLRERYPFPSILSVEDVSIVRSLISGLGFGSRRAKNLVAFAAAWVERPPEKASDVSLLPGCGRYAHDTWAIFMDGNLSIEPTDGRLVAYLERAR